MDDCICAHRPMGMYNNIKCACLSTILITCITFAVVLFPATKHTAKATCVHVLSSESSKAIYVYIASVCV